MCIRLRFPTDVSSSTKLGITLRWQQLTSWCHVYHVESCTMCDLQPVLMTCCQQTFFLLCQNLWLHSSQFRPVGHVGASIAFRMQAYFVPVCSSCFTTSYKFASRVCVILPTIRFRVVKFTLQKAQHSTCTRSNSAALTMPNKRQGAVQVLQGFPIVLVSGLGADRT